MFVIIFLVRRRHRSHATPTHGTRTSGVKYSVAVVVAAVQQHSCHYPRSPHRRCLYHSRNFFKFNNAPSSQSLAVANVLPFVFKCIALRWFNNTSQFCYCILIIPPSIFGLCFIHFHRCHLRSFTLLRFVRCVSLFLVCWNELFWNCTWHNIQVLKQCKWTLSDHCCCSDTWHD